MKANNISKIRILLADDHKVMRDGIQSLLEKQSDFEVVAIASDGLETLEQVKTKEIDVIIMDINMPNMSGIEATEKIKEIAPSIKIIALSVHRDQDFIAKMIQSGASGYLPKSAEAKVLIEAIHTVHKGKMYLCPTLVDSVFELVRNPSEMTDPTFQSLSPREREVLKLIAEGKTNKEISEALFVSENTIISHRQKIMNKTGLRSTAELTKYAIRHGLTSLH